VKLPDDLLPIKGNHDQLVFAIIAAASVVEDQLLPPDGEPNPDPFCSPEHHLRARYGLPREWNESFQDLVECQELIGPVGAALLRELAGQPYQRPSWLGDLPNYEGYQDAVLFAVDVAEAIVNEEYDPREWDGRP
jgi:hypothetical protein